MGKIICNGEQYGGGNLEDIDLHTYPYTRVTTESGCICHIFYDDEIFFTRLWHTDMTVSTTSNFEILELPNNIKFKYDFWYSTGVLLNANWTPTNTTLYISGTAANGIGVRGSTTATGVVCATIMLPRSLVEIS